MPEGLKGAVTRGGVLDGHVPDSVATIEVPHAGATRRYLALEGTACFGRRTGTSSVLRAGRIGAAIR
jgi:hypothetical protein